MTFDAKQWLLVGLALITLYHIATLWSGMKGQSDAKPTPLLIAIGFVTNFFDTLGIGSFATTTALFRATKTVPDDQIPGTLNAGHTMATLVQALIFTQAVDVEPTTLIGMIAAAAAGSWMGASLVGRWPIQRVRLGMGICLLGAAAMFLAQALNILPGGGEATGVAGIKLVIALSVNFALGVLMTIGIGLYGPCMLLVSLLGMNPKVAFPVMMGSCAFLMPTAAAQFIKLGRIHRPAVLSMIIGGLPAVLIAVYLVKSMDISTVRWLVVAVVTYTAITLLRASRSTSEAAAAA